MYVIIWEYSVKAEKQLEFEHVYSPDGEWTELFKKEAGYLSTELLHDTDKPWRYITIDRWTSLDAYNSFRENQRTEYETLDAHCEGLTEGESLIGSFSLV